jgi:hypothetical protein
MKKILTLILMMPVIIGCNDRINETNKEKQYAATKAAENSTENISELPLDFSFGMSERDVMNNLNRLLQDSIISEKHDGFSYEYKLSNGKKINTEIGFQFYEEELCGLCFSLPWDLDEGLIMEIDNDLTAKLDITYNRIFHYEAIDKETKYIFTKWFKENQYIYLRHAIGSDISYINAPIEKKANDGRLDKALERAREKDGIKVENSVYDESVRQVEKYLENTLKDPKSYKSIEWGKVQEKENGYTVYHRYRAKNSLGGYVVESHIFYMDLKGNVTKVE